MIEPACQVCHFISHGGTLAGRVQHAPGCPALSSALTSSEEPMPRPGRRALADVPMTAAITIPLTPDQRAEIDAAAVPETTTAWARGILLRQARRKAQGLELDVDVAPLPDPRRDEIERTERQMRELLALVPRLDDGEIAKRLDLSKHVVTTYRKQLGIPRAYDGGAKRTGWEERVRAAVEAGATMAEIGEAEGWTSRSVATKLSALRLTTQVRANEERRKLPPEPGE